MRIVICGGGGYIGTLLSQKLYELGHYIKVIDLFWFGNYLKKEIVCVKKDLFDCTEEDFSNFDQVIFLAGLSNDPMSDFDPKLNYLYNSSLPSYLANISKKAKVKRFIYGSSCSIYGFTKEKEITEDGEKLSNFPYGISKLQGEIGVKNIQDENFSTICLRMGTVGGYSPRMRFDVVLNAMYKSAIYKNKIIVNNPKIWRPILDIRDAVECYIKSVESDYSISGEFNLCSENITIGNLGKRIFNIIREIKKDDKLELINLEVQDNRNYIVDTKKAKEVLGFSPKYNVEDTIKEIHENFNDFPINKSKFLNIRVFERLFINKNYYETTKCRVCQCDTKLILDLNDQPLANSFHNGEKLENFPLKLLLCEKCFHSQLNVVVNPKILFSNYLYVSGTSHTLLEYFKWFVNFIERDYFKNGKILDIACNDCSLLDAFKYQGWKTYGVDPATNLIDNCKDKNHVLINDFWSSTLSEKIDDKFDVIVAQNVFAHLDDVHDFLEGCKNVMKKDSLLMIQTSQKNMFYNFEFDTIYHEHVSFFSIKSMNTLAESHGFFIKDILFPEIHGTSYLFILSLSNTNHEKINQELMKEEEKGRYNLKLYEDYSKKCYETKNIVAEKINNYRKLNKKIIGFGAAAKGNTFLNFCKLDLDYIVDENENKQNLYTPGMNIPVRNLKYFLGEKEEVVCVILAWNFSEEIVKKIKSKRNYKDKIIVFYPKYKEF